MTQARAVVLIWLMGLLLAAGVVVRTDFSTDMTAFLPRAAGAAPQLLVDQLRDGVVSRLMLVAVEHAPLPVLTALSRAMAANLRQDARFRLVENGEASAQSRLQALAWRHRYVLSPGVTPERFTVPGLRAALQQDIALLGSDLAPLVTRSLPADPTGEAQHLVQAVSARAHPASADGVWVSRAGDAALLMVSSQAAGFDIDAQEQGLARIRAAFTAAVQVVPQADTATLVTTGPPVFAVQSRARIKDDAELFSLIATGLVVAVLLLAYRSPRVLGLALLPVASGALAGIAAVAATFGFVHGITLGFGVTLIGEAVDYAIYLFTQTPPDGEPRAALRRIWPVLRLGMLTSVCGFSAMLLSRFTGFAQLGLFTIVGLVTALTVTRFVLPALLPERFSTEGSARFATPVLVLIRHRGRLRWVVLAASLVAALALVRHGVPYWEDSLSSMSPIPAADLGEDSRLRAELGAPDARFLLVASAGDQQGALMASERVTTRLAALVTAGVIAGFDSPSQILPSEATQRDRLAALPDDATLRDRLTEALQGLPLRADAFAPFLADVAAARATPLLQRADLDGTGFGLQLDALLLQHPASWSALLPLRGVTDATALASAIASLDLPGLVFLDLRRESDNLLASYRAEALTLSAIGGLAIVLLLVAALREPRRIAAVLLPLVAAVLCTAALVTADGARLSIFNLFGLLLVVAVGSNYCLFFERHDGGQTRMVASLVLADLCTVIGFGILAFSQVPVLHGIGGTVAIGACLSLMFGAVLSPKRP